MKRCTRVEQSAISKPQGSQALLSSWKDIANYLASSVRTVQRWEAKEGLPVRRPASIGSKKGVVLLYRKDADAWNACRRRNSTRQRQDQVRTDAAVTLEPEGLLERQQAFGRLGNTVASIAEQVATSVCLLTRILEITSTLSGEPDPWLSRKL